MKADSAKAGRRGHAKYLVDGKYSIKDLVGLEELRALFQSFTDTMGFTIGFLNASDLEILIATGWRDICTKLHRRCPLAAERCRASNARLVRHLKRPGQIVIEACENGLVDCATPIIIQGKIVAILATGQVLLQAPNIEYFKKQAKLFGCNEAAYLRALKEVPVISEKKLKQATRFLGELAHMVIRLGYAGLAEKGYAAERQLIQEREREVSKRLQAVFDNTFQFIALLKPDGRVMEVNHSALEFGGLAMKDIRDKFFWDCRWWRISKETQMKLRRAVAQASRGQFIRYPVEVLGKKRTKIAIDFSLKPVKNKKGQVVLLTAEGRDITEVRRAEDLLRQREASLRSIVDNQPGMVWLKDTKGKLLAVNRDFVKMAGKKKPEEVVGKTDFDLWPHVFCKKYRADDLRVMKSRQQLSVEELISERGVARWHETFKTPVLDADGKAIGTTGYARDITERKTTEEFLEKSAQEWQSTFDSVSDAVWLLGLDGRIVRANKATFRMFGKGKLGILGRRCCELVHGSKAPPRDCPLRRMLKSRCRESWEMSLQDRWFRVTVDPIFDGEGSLAGAVHIVSDITLRKRAEVALRLSEERFRTLIEQSPIAMAVVDVNGVIEYINRKAIEVFGYLPKDIPTMRQWWIRAYPNKAYRKKVTTDWMGRVRRATAEGQEVEGAEYRVTCKDRSEKTMFISGVRVSGKIFVLFDDITGRRQTEQALRNSEEKFRKLFEGSHDAMMTLEPPSWRFTSANMAMVRMFKAKNMKQLFKHSPWALSPRLQSDGRASDVKSKEMIRMAMLKGAHFFEWTHRRVDGETFPSEVLLTKVTKEGMGFLQATVRDITERKRTEVLLFQESGFRKAIIDRAAEGLCVCHEIAQFPHVLFTVWNKRMVEITGYTMKEINLRGWYQTVYADPQYRALAIARMAQMREGKDILGEEWIITRKNGEKRTLLISTSLVTGSEGQINVLGLMHDITERRRSEAALRESEERYRSIITLSRTGGWEYHRASDYLWCSTDYFLMLGIDPAEFEMTGKANLKETWIDLLHPEDRERASGHFAEYLKNGSVGMYENFFRMRHKDGSWVWIWSRGQTLRGADGAPTDLTVGTHIDITDQKRAEAALRESEERFRELIEGSADPQLMIDDSGRYVDCNRSALELLKMRNKEQLLGMHPADLSPERQPDGSLSREQAKSMIELAIKKGSHRFEWMHRKVDGEAFPVEVMATVLQRHGKMLLHAVWRDITDRRKAEELIRENRRQLLQIIDTVPHMIFAKDKEGRFLLVNRAVAEAYQKEPKDLIGVWRRDLHKNRQETEAFLKDDREVLSTGKPMLVSNEPFTDALGRTHILQTIKIPFQLIGEKGPCILGVSVDVTEQRKVEEFRNDIVRTVSHELRTPLSIEKEGISILIDEIVGPVNVEQKEILGTVMRNIDRLSRMITSLLDISSIETGKIKLSYQVTDLVALVKDVVFEFKKRAVEKGLDLSVKSSELEVPILADPDKITQVLSNLVDNAIKFTSKGAVEISLNVFKDAVECEVRDSGVGIAPENLGKMFEKFQQFSRVAGPGEKGFGLGLSIARGIIELHGGRIWVKSELGKGTQVVFSLPLSQKNED